MEELNSESGFPMIITSVRPDQRGIEVITWKKSCIGFLMCFGSQFIFLHDNVAKKIESQGFSNLTTDDWAIIIVMAAIFLLGVVLLLLDIKKIFRRRALTPFEDHVGVYQAGKFQHSLERKHLGDLTWHQSWLWYAFFFLIFPVYAICILCRKPGLSFQALPFVVPVLGLIISAILTRLRCNIIYYWNKSCDMGTAGRWEQARDLMLRACEVTPYLRRALCLSRMHLESVKVVQDNQQPGYLGQEAGQPSGRFNPRPMRNLSAL